MRSRKPHRSRQSVSGGGHSECRDAEKHLAYHFSGTVRSRGRWTMGKQMVENEVRELERAGPCRLWSTQ